MEIVQPGGGGSGGVDSVVNNDGTLTITPTTGDIVASLSGTLGSSRIVAVSSTPYNIGTTELVIFVDTSVARQINLPNPNTYRKITIKDSTGSTQTNNITIHRFAAESIEGLAADKVLATNWGAWTFSSNGTNWFMTD